ncbi:hypothetical protein DL89DRAFT_267396 [Linderina pennispora]|uniref:Large ribosomal subunit protein mL40 n=1 Tax=Linderina pennispora TaxID=61395 RepID=A0A1Y1W9I4_9FUNG|nr:uncharacterized protein DL89DRAFT_267396 [Linderina pennispora]ORX70173.1 hypothetical protein DL89DRAFT_267396 [Linderina pennispora]
MNFSTRALLSTRTRVGVLRKQAVTKAMKQNMDGRPTHNSADPRYDLMKKVLFTDSPRALPEMSSEDMERHATILRADKIHRMEASRNRREERERKFQAMEAAYQRLEAADMRLFEGACVREANTTFPRQMRVPTETPGNRIWEYL